MKVKKLINRLYEAIVSKDKDGEKKIWKKLIEKSLKHKNTHAVK